MKCQKDESCDTNQASAPCDALKDSVAVEVVSLSVPVRSFGVPFHD